MRRLIALLLVFALTLAGAPHGRAEDQPVFAETPANLARLRHMTESLTTFVVMHELGHFLIDALDAPILGREEDAADRFATLMMTPPPRPPGLPPERFDPAFELAVPGVIWAATWWHDSHFNNFSRLGLDVPWWSEHGIDEQRAAQIMCLVYGADPPRFEAAFAAYIPPERRESCIAESASNARAWNQILSPHVAGGGNQPHYAATVTFERPPNELVRAKVTLQLSQVLERAAAIVRELAVPADSPWLSDPLQTRDLSSWLAANPHRITIRGATCLGDDGLYVENAFWDGANAQLLVCYGLVRSFEAYARQKIAATPLGQDP